MTAHTHNCAAAGCQKQIPLNLLMCMTHWRMVPAPVQREVLTSWRALGRNRQSLELALAYRVATDKAAAAVDAKENRRIADKRKAAPELFTEI